MQFCITFFLYLCYNTQGDYFMNYSKENVSLIQLDLDNERSEYELNAIKLTMDGCKEESQYILKIIEVYREVSDLLDKTYNMDKDKFLASLKEEYIKERDYYLSHFHNFDDLGDSFISGLKLEYLDMLYTKVVNRINL